MPRPLHATLAEGYYTSFASLCKTRDLVKDFCEALIYAGLSDVVVWQGLRHTPACV